MAKSPQALANDRRRRGDGSRPQPGKRHFDPALQAYVIQILPGTHYVTAAVDEILATILGSCVAACVRDPYQGIGGMNHFMLPKGRNDATEGANDSMRYGDYAMEVLINAVLAHGCRRSELEIKIFGGANVIDSTMLVGSNNSEFIIRYLNSNGLLIATRDIGGRLPRRILYTPATGKARRLNLKRLSDSNIFKKELAHYRRSKRMPDSGEIDLF